MKWNGIIELMIYSDRVISNKCEAIYVKEGGGGGGGAKTKKSIVSEQIFIQTALSQKRRVKVYIF